jgi:hypothetical protein
LWGIKAPWRLKEAIPKARLTPSGRGVTHFLLIFAPELTPWLRYEFTPFLANPLRYNRLLHTYI